MTPKELSEKYTSYIDCLNRQDWGNLGQFVHGDAVHNGKKFGLSGYREMLEADYRSIPDLGFKISLLVSDPPLIASRLHFDCTPRATLFGMPVNGKRVQFDENVFYQFSDGKIREVWSIIDKAAILAQI